MLCDGSDSPDTASRQGKGIARWLFPAALIAAGWFIFLQIPWHADDTGMMIVSASFANLQKFGMSHYAHQLAVNLPLMALIWIFGYSTTAYYIFAFIFYFMFAASIGLISDNILSQKSRFGPAFVILIILCSSLTGQMSSAVTSDYPSAAFIVLSFFFFIKSQEREGRARNRFLITAALLGFAGYSAKISAVAFLISIPAYEFLRARRFSSTMRFAAYFAAGLIFELAFNTILHGDAFIRFKIFSSAAIGQINLPESASWWDFLLRVPKVWWGTFDGKILLSLGIPGALLALVHSKRPTVSAILIGAAALFSIYAFPVISVHPIIPAVRVVTRHYIIIYGILAIFGTYAIIFASGILNRITKISPNVFCWTIITIITAFLSADYYNNCYFCTKFLIMRGAKDKYASASHDFDEYLKHNDKPDGHVYALGERNYKLYHGFRDLDIIDAERFGHPKAPTYVLSLYNEIYFYIDQFSAIRNFEMVELFQRLVRPSSMTYPLFRSGQMFLHKVDAWVTNSTLVAGPSPSATSLRILGATQAQDGDALLLKPAPASQGAITITACLASSNGTSFPPGTYGVDFEAEVDTKATLEFRVRHASGVEPNFVGVPVRTFDFEGSSATGRYVIHRFRDFQNVASDEPTCIDAVVTNSTSVLLKRLGIRHYMVPNAAPKTEAVLPRE